MNAGPAVEDSFTDEEYEERNQKWSDEQRFA
jgi:hypothetical protein